jgi:hypothetical protein
VTRVRASEQPSSNIREGNRQAGRLHSQPGRSEAPRAPQPGPRGLLGLGWPTIITERRSPRDTRPPIDSIRSVRRAGTLAVLTSLPQPALPHGMGAQGAPRAVQKLRAPRVAALQQRFREPARPATRCASLMISSQPRARVTGPAAKSQDDLICLLDLLEVRI